MADNTMNERIKRRLEAMTLELRELITNPGDPAGWPDWAKLRLVALHFDARELGLPDPLEWDGGTEVQDDLRRIASYLRSESE